MVTLYSDYVCLTHEEYLQFKLFEKQNKAIKKVLNNKLGFSDEELDKSLSPGPEILKISETTGELVKVISWVF